VHSLSLGYHRSLSLWFHKWLQTLILHLFCRVVDVKADPTLKLVSAASLTQFRWSLMDSPNPLTSYRQHQVQSWKICWDLHRSCVMSAQSSKDDHLWSRVTVHCSLLGATACILRTHLICTSAYHPQMDGQTNWANQILEDMLRACVMEYPGSWDKNLPWAKFLYNNNYRESLKTAPSEVLYGCRCRIPPNWIEPGEKVVFGLDIID
jgi:hypothetical protein